MKRIVRVGVPSLALAVAFIATPAGAGEPQEITFGDNFFTPRSPPAKGVSQVGTEVAWLGPDAAKPHNIHQDDRLFRSGPPNDVAEYQADVSAGRYHYYCQIHGSKAGGMDGVLRIAPVSVLPDGDSTRVIWADSEAEPRHRFEVQFRREGASKWRTWRRTTKQVQGEFGAGDRPIDANPSRNYQVRVRTFVKGNRDRRSDWSPRVAFSVQP